MTESNRCQIELRLSAADLHRALGPAGSPVTLAFSYDALTLTTPSSRMTIRGRTVASGSGTQTAGVRPSEADALRAATAGADMTARLLANALTLTLVLPDRAVTIGRW